VPLLDRQLEWLHGELTALDVSWELRVHDNCSTDDTSAVVGRWRDAFGPDVFRDLRHAENVFGIPNYVSALERAQGTWTWCIGDDDVLHDGTTQEIVDPLQEQPDLTLLFLDFCGIDGETGAATKKGYAAARGPIYVTPDVHMDCVVGVSHWQREPDRWLRNIYHDTPSVFLQLAHQGYPPFECRDQGLGMLRFEVSKTAVRSHLRAVKACPRWLMVIPRLYLTRGSGPTPPDAAAAAAAVARRASADRRRYGSRRIRSRLGRR
jgi:hypothetical protein